MAMDLLSPVFNQINQRCMLKALLSTDCDLTINAWLKSLSANPFGRSYNAFKYGWKDPKAKHDWEDVLLGGGGGGQREGFS